MTKDREVAGIRCFEVLALLPDYLEDELSAEEREQIEEHLQGCTWCAEFGGAYGAVVKELQELLLDDEDS